MAMFSGPSSFEDASLQPERTSITADRMRCTIGPILTEASITTGMLRIATIVRGFIAGCTIRGGHQFDIAGAGLEARGTATTAITLRPIHTIQAQRSGLPIS